MPILSLTSPLQTACKIAYKPHALLIVCLKKRTSPSGRSPSIICNILSSSRTLFSYNSVVGKTNISAYAGLGRNASKSGSSNDSTSWNSSDLDKPNLCISSVKSSGLDSRGMKCLRYVRGGAGIEFIFPPWKVVDWFANAAMMRESPLAAWKLASYFGARYSALLHDPRGDWQNVPPLIYMTVRKHVRGIKTAIYSET
jgi:hypothetical protein